MPFASTITKAVGYSAFLFATYPLVKEQFFLYRFLGHEMQPELQEKLEEHFPKEFISCVQQLKNTQNFAWNYMTPFLFISSFTFHTIRYFSHPNYKSYHYSKKLFYAFNYSVSPAIIGFLAPFYLFTYWFNSKSLCKSVVLQYYRFVLDQKDPQWRNNVALLDNGNIVPVQYARGTEKLL